MRRNLKTMLHGRSTVAINTKTRGIYLVKDVETYVNKIGTLNKSCVEDAENILKNKEKQPHINEDIIRQFIEYSMNKHV